MPQYAKLLKLLYIKFLKPDIISIMLRQISIEGYQASYAQLNPNQPKTIVLVHGIMGDHSGLLDLARRLKGYRIIIPDLAGHGSSDTLKSEHNAKTHARFLASFLEALDIEAAVLVGHSYGALVCLHYSTQYPDSRAVRQLILLAPPYPEHQRNFAYLASRAVYHTIRITPEPISQRMLASNFYNRASAKMFFVSDDAELKAQLLRQGQIATRKVPKRVATEIAADLPSLPVVKLFNQLTLDTTIVYGGKDKLGNIEHLESKITNPKIKLLKFDDFGHLFPLEEPQKTADIILQIINQPKIRANIGSK